MSVLHDNLQWDDVFHVWFEPGKPEALPDLTEEDLEQISERADRWLMDVAGIL